MGKQMPKTSAKKLSYILQWQRDNPDKVAKRIARWNNRQNAKGLCRQCNRPLVCGKTQCEWHLKKSADRVRFNKYGITRAERDAMREKQNGQCAICGENESGKGLFIDHDHTTGKVRALLCHLCNVGIGNFRENPAWLECAAMYIRHYYPTAKG